MERRDFLKSMGLFGSAGALGAPRGEAAQAAGTPPAPDFRVGSLDLSSFEMIDTHVHPTQKLTLSTSYENQLARFAEMTMPAGEFPERAALQDEMIEAWREHQYELPRRIGYFNYVARVYGVEPTAESFDAIVQKGIDRDFTGYIRSILDREKIVSCVYQVRAADTAFPTTDFPSDRFVWTFPLIALLQPDWAKSKGATTLADVLYHLDRTIDECAANKCAGFKSAVANYRTLDVQPVGERQAEGALKTLLSTVPNGYQAASGEKVPLYREPAAKEALKQYQDFLLKHLFIKAGRLERPILIHIAAALNPGHRAYWQNPQGLYTVFEDDDIRRARTQFVVLHTGFPSHHVVASMLSQFTNVFADMSFFSKFPGTLEETYRTFLGLVPSGKVMHGGDSNDVPEEIGYCASNTRRVLARILNDFRSYYGWSESDCAKIAANVMSKNARKLFRITA